MNKKSISLVLGIMCLILTYGIAVQVKTVSGTGTAVATTSSENQLRDAVLKEKEKYDNLYEELERMETQLEIERTNSTQNNTELSKLENTIKEGNKVLGLSEVTGYGIIVTVDDNKNVTIKNIIDPNWLVHDLDLIHIVNELKSVGAEAISINGQRIITTSAIECDGNVVMVNGEKISAPFEIKAIGLPESLMSITMYGSYVYNLENERLDISIEKSDKEKITIPKYTGVIKNEYTETE